MEEYYFEKLTPEHLPKLLDLYSNAFGQKVNILELKKKFDTFDLGLDPIGFFATHSMTKQVVAYYGVFPMKAKFGINQIQIAQSGDTMTHTEHRRKGLFIQLAHKTYEECIRLGIEVIIGQPNKNSEHGLINSLGWIHLDNIIRWDLKLKFKTLPLSRLAHKSTIFQRFFLNYARLICKAHSIKEPSSFNNSIPTDYIKIVRDSSYIEYKTTKNKFFLQIKDVVFWINLTDVFWIGEINNYEKITPEILKKLRMICFWMGYNTISLNLNKSIDIPKTLKKFKINHEEKSCFYYLNNDLKGRNFLLTAADFDTW